MAKWFKGRHVLNGSPRYGEFVWEEVAFGDDFSCVMLEP
jgi:hypothetical protein